MKICVRAHDFGRDTSYEIAKKIKLYGFDGVQLAINKAIINKNNQSGLMDQQFVKDIAADFKENNLEVALLGAYFNPVHSNKEKVLTGIKNFKEHLAFTSTFDCKYVGTETGSFNDDEWTFNQRNRTEEAYKQVKKIFKDILNYAKMVKANVAIEGAFGHCIYEPKVLKRLLDEIDNGHMFITLDLYNYLDIENYLNHTKIFDECIELFQDKIVIFHLKDFVIDNGKLCQVGLGEGLMNFDYILPCINKYYSKAYLVFEGIQMENMASSFQYVSKYFSD